MRKTEMESEKRRSPTAPDPVALQKWFDNAITNANKPKPQYTENCSAKTNLHYDCTMWASSGNIFPTNTSQIINQVEPVWLTDGLKLEKYLIKDDKIQILFYAKHNIAPITFVSRIKGRLQHALRQADTPIKFSRKVAFRSLGDNISTVVAGYLEKQVSKDDFADPRFRKHMEQYTVINDNVDLATPCATTRGRYWYNLHLVLVTDGRYRFIKEEKLSTLRDGCIKISKKKNYRLKGVAIMPDHIHLALGVPPKYSAADVALSFMNNLAWLMKNRVWQNGYYIGSFSEYALKNL